MLDINIIAKKKTAVMKCCIINHLSFIFYELFDVFVKYSLYHRLEKVKNLVAFTAS